MKRAHYIIGIPLFALALAWLVLWLEPLIQAALRELGR